jgi:hypothetical protein
MFSMAAITASQSSMSCSIMAFPSLKVMCWISKCSGQSQLMCLDWQHWQTNPLN